MDEWILLLVIFIQFASSIVIKEQLLSLEDVTFSEEAHLVPATAQHLLRIQILPPLVIVVYKTRIVAPKTSIYRPLLARKVVKSAIHAQNLSQQVDAVVNQLPRVNCQQLTLSQLLPSKQAQSCSCNSRLPHSDPLAASLQHLVVLAVRFIEAVEAQRRVTLLVIFSAGTLLAATIVLPTVAPAFTNLAVAIAETLWKTEISLATCTPLTSPVYHALLKKIMNTRSNLATVLTLIQFRSLFLSFPIHCLAALESLFAIDAQQCFSLTRLQSSLQSSPQVVIFNKVEEDQITTHSLIGKQQPQLAGRIRVHVNSDLDDTFNHRLQQAASSGLQLLPRGSSQVFVAF